MQIKDQNGRVGTVTEDRGDVLFAKPEGIEYVVKDDAGITGVPNAEIITATAWCVQPDGSLVGLWYDSPLHTSLRAQKITEQSL